MATHCKIMLKVRVAWWLRLYIYGVTAMCRITGLEPDWNKVAAIVRKAVKLDVVDAER